MLMRRYGHVLMRRYGHVLMRRYGYVLMRRYGHVLMRRYGHVLMRRYGNVLMRRSYFMAILFMGDTTGLVFLTLVFLLSTYILLAVFHLQKDMIPGVLDLGRLVE